MTLKTDNIYLTHKLPLLERKEKSYKLYGQAIEKHQKDLKTKKDELEVLKKMLLVKMH